MGSAAEARGKHPECRVGFCRCRRGTGRNHNRSRKNRLAVIPPRVPREGAEAPDLAGTRYRLLERVARGGMGVVYAAQDENLQRRVALKVLDIPGTDGDLPSRLVREARVLAALEHPGIVPVHDVGTL